MTEPKFEVVDDYTVKYDGDYFDLHKPSDIRNLVTVANYIVTENQQLKKENKLLEIEDENWTKLSEEDENTINRLNTKNEQLLTIVNKYTEILYSFSKRDLTDIERIFLNNLCKELGVNLTEYNPFTWDNPIMYDKENGRCRCIPIPYK